MGPDTKRWRMVSDGYWQYLDWLSVYGTVTPTEDGKFLWCARVMVACRLPDIGGPPPRGKALTLEGAKKVVELLCEVTGT
ncbi:MAG: hypothetical protein PVG39_02335 [Desulfobacteraceae bacterium]|jgi:hypothetical protein